MAKVLTHDEIVDRERALYAAALEKRQDPVFLLAQDRLKRWTSFMENFPVRQEVLDWAKRMEEKTGYGEVRMWNTTVPWVLGLMICRYGEAEYHWPLDGFSDEDVKRCEEWLKKDRLPEGCIHLSSV